jgi:hypothetical protein
MKIAYADATPPEAGTEVVLAARSSHGAEAAELDRRTPVSEGRAI